MFISEHFIIILIIKDIRKPNKPLDLQSIMKKKHLIILIILFIIILILILSVQVFRKPNNNDIEINENKVTRVIDGDTFVLQSGVIIRLICVNAPERGEKGYEEAKIFLENMVLNKSVTLEKDISEKDIYNRSLRYVFMGNLFINKELVRNNHAKLFRYGNDTKRCDEIASF